MVGRAGESVVLGCDLLPPAGRPPLHVIEWLRFGFLLPIFIQFGLYSPRIDPDYVGKTQERGTIVTTARAGWVGGGQDLVLTALPPPATVLCQLASSRLLGSGLMGIRVGGSMACLLLQWGLGWVCGHRCTSMAGGPGRARAPKDQGMDGARLGYLAPVLSVWTPPPPPPSATPAGSLRGLAFLLTPDGVLI